ncbi:hypothetical protein TVAG_322210, partial [Trichomonas vaginalis G3]
KNRKLQNHNSLLSNLSSSKYLRFTTNFHLNVTTHHKASRTTLLLSLCLTSPNPWMFMQNPAPQSQSQSKRDQEFEEGLNRLRKEYATTPMEEDRLSLSSLKSTDSTRTTDSVRDREDYLKQSERLFILQPFTVGALKNMRNYEGQTPAGDRKTDVLARAVQLVKTKTEIVDFILAACPYK